MTQTIVGLFHSPEDAQRAAMELPTGEFHDIPQSEKIGGDPLHPRPSGQWTQVAEDPINEIAIGEEGQPR